MSGYAFALWTHVDSSTTKTQSCHCSPPESFDPVLSSNVPRRNSSPKGSSSVSPRGDVSVLIRVNAAFGYRIQVLINSGRKKVYTRNGLDWTKRFSAIAGALDFSGQAIIDGQVVVVHEGRTNFSELQAELAAVKQDRLVYYAFDTSSGVVEIASYSGSERSRGPLRPRGLAICPNKRVQRHAH